MMLNKNKITTSETIHNLIAQRNEEIEEKIEKSLKKKEHILRLEKEMEERAQAKNKELLRKINKSIEIKNKNMEKLKKKCHMRIQYEKEKMIEHKKKQKQELILSWKKSQKLGIYLPSKKSLQKKESFRMLTAPPEESSTSQNNEEENQRISSKSYKLPIFERRRMETQKAEVEIQKMRKSEEKIGRSKSERKNYVTQMVDHDQSMDLEKVRLVEKKKEQEEKKKIKNLSKKLDKIDQTRMKKQKIQKDRQKKIHDFLEYKEYEYKERDKEKRNSVSNAPKRRHDRVKSEINYIYSRSPKNQMFKKWEEENKIRQRQLFAKRLHQGTLYLQKMEHKSSRNKMTRQIEDSSIQKKLYLQRKRLSSLFIKNTH